jgi:hypothetical protein
LPIRARAIARRSESGPQGSTGHDRRAVVTGLDTSPYRTNFHPEIVYLFTKDPVVIWPLHPIGLDIEAPFWK